MDIKLFIKEGTIYKVIKVPSYVVKNLLRDRLSQSEMDRIHRLAEPIKIPDNFKAGSVIVDFASKTADCYQTKIDLTSFDPTWKVNNERLTLNNY